MKYRILSTFGLFVAAIFIFSACTKSDINKANDDYDWSKVQPKIFGFSGPSSGAASGLAPLTYKVNPRGGSSYTFEVIDHGATIVIDEEWPQIAYVTWDQSGVAVDCQITVYETTSAGLVSEKDTIDVSLGPFCPKVAGDFVGSWTGTETGDSEVAPLNVTFVAGTGDQVIGEAIAGIPVFLSTVFTGWGEVFQDGFGNEGDITININLLTGAVTLPMEYWGQTLPGPWNYDVHGGGSWSGCGSHTMSFNVLMDASGWNESQVEITKN